MRNPMDMSGRTVVVTGAGQGIGKAISELFLDLGGNVVLVERNPDTLASRRLMVRADRPASPSSSRTTPRPRRGARWDLMNPNTSAVLTSAGSSPPR